MDRRAHGLACDDAARALGDFMQVTLDEQNRAAITFGSAFESPSGTLVVRQTG